MKKILLTMVVATLLASCATTNRSVSSTPVGIRAVPDPLKVDYTVDINKKLTGESKSVWILGFIKIAGDPTYADGMNYSSNFGTGQEGFMRLFGALATMKVTQAKAAAAYKALENSNADFIANPNYVTKQRKILFGIIKTYNAQVTGWSGRYTKAYQGAPERKYRIVED